MIIVPEQYPTHLRPPNTIMAEPGEFHVRIVPFKFSLTNETVALSLLIAGGQLGSSADCSQLTVTAGSYK